MAALAEEWNLDVEVLEKLTRNFNSVSVTVSPGKPGEEIETVSESIISRPVTTGIDLRSAIRSPSSSCNSPRAGIMGGAFAGAFAQAVVLALALNL